MTGRLIDTHLHIWNFERAAYDWLQSDLSILNRTYDITEITTDRISVGVTEGVLVQAANNAEDTGWMLQVAEHTDWITGVVGWVPLIDPDKTEKLLTGNYLSNRYFKGVRHLIHDEADPKWLLQEKVIESLKLLSAHNLSYDLVGVLPAHIETALEVAGKVPGLKIVFDHLNQPPFGDKAKNGPWRDLMSEASRHDQFFVKISGLGTASKKRKGWSAEDIQPCIAFVIEKFGEDRCFCGGDWPVCLLTGSYTKTWDAYKQVLKGLLDEDAAAKVFYRNAEQFYNL